MRLTRICTLLLQLSAMTCPAFLRLITQKSQASLGLYSLQISCHVKPNVAAGHAGVTRVGTDRVDISVSVAPRENAANAAVSEIIAEVCEKYPLWKPLGLHIIQYC